MPLKEKTAQSIKVKSVQSISIFIARTCRWAAAIACFASQSGCTPTQTTAPATAPQSPPPTMSIAAGRNCYRVLYDNKKPNCATVSDAGATSDTVTVSAHFYVAAVSTPNKTNGTVNVVVTSKSKSFTARKVECTFGLDANPKDMDFEVQMPPDAMECTQFALHLSAKSGTNTYSGLVDNPCE